MVVVYMSNPDDFVLSGSILILVVVYMGNPMTLSYQGVF